MLQTTGWRGVGIATALAIAIGLLFGTEWKSGLVSLMMRMIALGLTAVLVFGIFDQWPKRLPSWVARWVLQVVAVGLAMPLMTTAIYVVSTDIGAAPFWQERERFEGFLGIAVVSTLIAPWAALAALVRQKDALAQRQALEFELTRSELERQALDARLHLLQAQVAPHFLFNTLANIQALVDAGSPQASTLLRTLIAYLRAAVPLLNEPAATLDQEVQLARAYLELMHMRIPDRLTFAVHVDETALPVRCPPTTLLTLVENAVRHGVDPSEEGGRIEIDIRRSGDRVTIRVSDTGAGLRQTVQGLGTGLSTLRERLQLMFGNDAQLRIAAQTPRGVAAEVELPAVGGR